MLSKIQNEWTIFKQDFKRQSADSFLFWFNWYILKPIAIILCIVAFVIV